MQISHFCPCGECPSQMSQCNQRPKRSFVWLKFCMLNSTVFHFRQMPKLNYVLYTLLCSFPEMNPVMIWMSAKVITLLYNYYLSLSKIYFPPKTYSRNGFYWENTLLYCRWRWQSLPPRGLFPLPCSINSLCFGLALPSLKIPLRLYPISYFKSQPG